LKSHYVASGISEIRESFSDSFTIFSKRFNGRNQSRRWKVVGLPQGDFDLVHKDTLFYVVPSGFEFFPFDETFTVEDHDQLMNTVWKAMEETVGYEVECGSTGNGIKYHDLETVVNCCGEEKATLLYEYLLRDESQVSFSPKPKRRIYHKQKRQPYPDREIRKIDFKNDGLENIIRTFKSEWKIGREELECELVSGLKSTQNFKESETYLIHLVLEQIENSQSPFLGSTKDFFQTVKTEVQRLTE
jgi:hypothetical protein